MIVVSKPDLVDPDQLGEVVSLVRALNPRARIAVDQIAEAVTRGLIEIGVADGPTRRALVDDVALLGRTVAEAAARSHVLVREWWAERAC